MFFNHIQAIGPRVAAMNDDGLFCTPRQNHLILENTRLHFARGMIVKIVESDFAPGYDFRMLSQSCQFFQMLRCDFLRFVRVNANRGVNPLMLFGKGQRGIELFGPWAGADREERAHSSSAGAFEHGIAVLRELWEIDVRMRINQFH